MMAKKKGKKKNSNNKGTSKKRSPDKTEQTNLPELPSKEFNIFITMESDWHIGSGGGIPGNVDRLVQRDSERIPGSISAKTLTGVWRDACESVALGLDRGKEGVWSQYVVYLFGDQPALNEDSEIANPPIGAALNIRPAKLHRDIRNAILERCDLVKQAFIKAMTMSKPGICIDPHTGCAIEKFLRQEEMVRAGTYLTSECKLNLEELNDKQKRAAWALLIAGAKYLDKLGGKRRRGAGKCKLNFADAKDQYKEIKDKEIEKWLDWIENNLSPPKPFKDAEYSNGDLVNRELKETNSNTEQTWYKIPLTITAKLPVIIRARTVGNIVETLDYIPGNKLLPIIAKKLNNFGINIFEAITNHQLIVTNATLKVDNRGGRAVPVALFYEKMSGGFDQGHVYNQLSETPSEDKQLKGYRQGYVGQTEQQNDVLKTLPNYALVNTVIQTHNTIDDASQRPIEEIGGVYSYQAIEAGTILLAELRITQNLIDVLSKDSQWWHQLGGTENIGTSKKDDYGLVKISVNEPTKIEGNNNVITAEEHQLIVWLLSDVLIRDRQLRPSISLDDFKQTLKQALSKNLPEGKEINLTLKLKDNSQEDSFPIAYVRQRRTESWQKRWCLPRPSLTGLMAGSCIEFGIETDLDLADLNRRLEHLAIVGIGERTIEGYGQISFNDLLLQKETSQIPAKSKLDNIVDRQTDTVSKISPDNNSFVYARLIETQAWRNVISNAAKTLASNPQSREQLLGIKVMGDDNQESCPSMSQLGNLRTFIARLREPKDIKPVVSWIKSTQEKRAKKWEKTNDGLEKIKTLVSSERHIWEELAKHTDIPLKDLTLTENAEKFLSEQQWAEVKKSSIATYLNNHNHANSLRLVLWSEAIRTLVYECILAHKRDFE